MDIQAIIRSRDDLARIVGLREKELQNLYLTAAALLDDIESIQAKLARVEEIKHEYRTGLICDADAALDLIEQALEQDDGK